MKVIIELLGTAGVQMPIHDFNSSKAPHALSILPGKLGLIDDDVKKSVVLPDDFLKKISENKALYANPKGDNMTPAEVFFGGAEEIKGKREEIKQETMKQRRQLNRQMATNTLFLEW